MTVRSYETWARKHDKKCRSFSHYEGNQRVFRVTNRPTLLRDDGFVLSSGIAYLSADAPTPRKAVGVLIDGFDYQEVVYYPDRLSNEIIVWVKSSNVDVAN